MTNSEIIGIARLQYVAFDTAEGSNERRVLAEMRKEASAADLLLIDETCRLMQGDALAVSSPNADELRAVATAMGGRVTEDQQGYFWVDGWPDLRAASSGARTP